MIFAQQKKESLQKLSRDFKNSSIFKQGVQVEFLTVCKIINQL